MKKIILTLVAVMALGTVNAQLREKGTFELTPQIGYSSANYYGQKVTKNNEPISTAAYGVGADYFFNDRWSLRSGLFFQTMGTQFSNIVEKLNYITVPVNASWHFGSTRKWNLNFGPSVGFLSSANTNGFDIKDAVNSTQIGLNIGIGYKIEVSEQFSILVDYQSQSGLTDVAKQISNVKNAFGAFSVGAVVKL